MGYVCADLDTFVMDNSGTKKEAVSRTYQGVDGYTPIALYLGCEGWNIGLELRPGSHHSVRKTEYFLERVFPRLERLCPQDAKVLLRADSGFDSARLLFAKAAEQDRWAGLGRSLSPLLFSIELPGSAQAEGWVSSWSWKITSHRPASADFPGRKKAMIAPPERPLADRSPASPD